jgi:hypothetical protein
MFSSFEQLWPVVVLFVLEASGHGCTLAEPSIGLMQVGLPCSMEDERLDEGRSRVLPAIVDIRDAVQLPLQRFEIRSSSRVRLPDPMLNLHDLPRFENNWVRTGRSDRFTIAGWKTMESQAEEKISNTLL